MLETPCVFFFFLSFSGFVMGQKIRPLLLGGFTTPGLPEWDKKGSPD